MKPNRENIAKWVTALRSGGYTQAKSRLRKDAAMCCLGVACHISEIGRWDDDGRYVTATDRSFSALPEEVQVWLGFDNSDPDLQTGLEYDAGISVSATSLNDYRNFTFADIADALERTYLEAPNVA